MPRNVWPRVATGRRSRGVRRSRAFAALVTLAFSTLSLGLLAPPATAATVEDYGDAPLEYDLTELGPARSAVAGPRLGLLVTPDEVDPQTGVSSRASETALGDAGDDATGPLAALPSGRLIRTAVSLTVSQVTEAARVCGWIDFDRNRIFTVGERSCAGLAVGDREVELTWVGRPSELGRSYLRLRIGTEAEEVEEPSGPSASGEVEDHPVQFTRPAPTPAPRPGLTLTTTAEPRVLERLGAPLTWTYAVRNSGTVPLRDVRVRDANAPSGLTCSPTAPADLAPGATLRCTAQLPLTQRLLDFGSVDGAAEARGEVPDGDPAERSDDVVAVGPARVEVRQRPKLSLALSSSHPRPRPGTWVTLTLTARNSGNVTLTRPRVTSNLPGVGALTCSPEGPERLAPGGQVVCTGRRTVTQADARRGRLTLQGTVRAEPPYGNPGRSADDALARASRSVSVEASQAVKDDRSGDDGGDGSGNPGGAGGSGGSGGSGSSGGPRGSGDGGTSSGGAGSGVPRELPPPPNADPSAAPSAEPLRSRALAEGGAGALATLVAGVGMLASATGVTLLGRSRRRRRRRRRAG